MRAFTLLIVFFLSLQSFAQTKVQFYTNHGDFKLVLFDTIVPVTTSNFISLVQQKRYDNTTFHRVINNFMIQGGDINPPADTIPDEFDASLSNTLGTISMANLGPNTGTSQFFINLVNNNYLDFDKPPYTSQHAVFGTTINGFGIVQTIGTTPTDTNDAPITPVVVDSIRILSLHVSDIEAVKRDDKKELIKVFDPLGRSHSKRKGQLLFYLYSDGTMEKKIVW
jgi:peptidylprolyl isomerase